MQQVTHRRWKRVKRLNQLVSTQTIPKGPSFPPKNLTFHSRHGNMADHKRPQKWSVRTRNGIAADNGVTEKNKIRNKNRTSILLQTYQSLAKSAEYHDCAMEVARDLKVEPCWSWKYREHKANRPRLPNWGLDRLVLSKLENWKVHNNSRVTDTINQVK